MQKRSRRLPPTVPTRPPALPPRLLKKTSQAIGCSMTPLLAASLARRLLITWGELHQGLYHGPATHSSRNGRTAWGPRYGRFDLTWEQGTGQGHLAPWKAVLSSPALAEQCWCIHSRRVSNLRLHVEFKLHLYDPFSSSSALPVSNGTELKAFEAKLSHLLPASR